MPSPPRLAERFLLWFLRPELAEEVLGDLEEQYFETLEEKGKRRADLIFYWQVLNYLRPFAWKRSFRVNPTLIAMFKHTFTLTFRHAVKARTSFWVNVLGLTAGLTFALLIFLWVADELRVDHFHKYDERLYAIRQNIPMGPGQWFNVDGSPALLAEALKEEMPEVEDAGLIQSNWQDTKGILKAGDKLAKGKELYVSPNFFSLFSFDLIEGDPATALQSPNAVLLSESTAKRLFRNPSDAIGKTVSWEMDWFNASGLFEVAGVFRDPPAYSSMQFDVLFSFPYLFNKNLESFNRWDNNNPQTYVLLKEGADSEQFAEKIKDYLSVKRKAENPEDDLDMAGKLLLVRFADQYLYNLYDNGILAGGRISYVRLFSLVAILILLIAGINFMNLSTARAAQRMREVGVKKSLGVTRPQLMGQFLGEAVFMSLLSLLLALGAVYLLLPQFNMLTDKELSLAFTFGEGMILLGLVVLLGLFAGSYPAVYLSGFKPAEVLKGKWAPSSKTGWLRQGLVVGQFVVSLVFIMAVVVVYQQIQLIHHQNLGYSKERVITFKREGRLSEDLGIFMQQTREIPGVAAVSSMGHSLMNGYGYTSGGLSWPGMKEGDRGDFAMMDVDYGFFELVEMQMKEGRTFSQEYGADTLKIIFNESAIESMGLENPVGQFVTLWGKPGYEIIGVVKDFHYSSLHARIRPMFIKLDENLTNVYVKLEAGNQAQTLDRIREAYTEFNGGLPFEYRFLEEDYEALYAAETRVATLSRYFAVIAILISCLGLFGLVSYSAERRIKEIGIRKVLGASAWSLLSLLSREYTRMVGLAILIALPLGYYISYEWLNGYEYRVEMKPWYLIFAALVGLCIAWLTVSIQTLKTVRINPVEALRSE